VNKGNLSREKNFKQKGVRGLAVGLFGRRIHLKGKRRGWGVLKLVGVFLTVSFDENGIEQNDGIGSSRGTTGD